MFTPATMDKVTALGDQKKSEAENMIQRAAHNITSTMMTDMWEAGYRQACFDHGIAVPEVI